MLAVNTAGMLVRRRVLEELGGFDASCPIFGNDLDFGWRAAAAGHRTVVVPQAVVFHAEAAHRGIRRTPLTGRHTHYQERRAALFTLLANSPGPPLPLAGRPAGVRHASADGRLPAGPVRRRGPGRARGAGLVYSRPGASSSPPGARARAGSAAEPATYAPAGRRGGCPTATGSTSSATSPRPRPTRPPTWPSGAGPRPRSADPHAAAAPAGEPTTRTRSVEDTGAVARFFTNPVARRAGRCSWCWRLVGAREAFGSVAGGGLSPGAGAASRLVAAPRRVVAPARAGHRGPGPAYLLPWPLLATLLGVSPTAAVSLLLVLAVPVAALGRLAVPPRRRPAGSPAGAAALAGPLGRHDVRPGPGRQRRLGRGAASASVTSPRRCCRGWRMPRWASPIPSRPPLARRLALRPAPRARGRVRARRLTAGTNAGAARGTGRSASRPASADRDGSTKPRAACASQGSSAARPPRRTDPRPRRRWRPGSGRTSRRPRRPASAAPRWRDQSPTTRPNRQAPQGARGTASRSSAVTAAVGVPPSRVASAASGSRYAGAGTAVP